MLLLSLFKMLINVVLFITLPNLKQVIYRKCCAWKSLVYIKKSCLNFSVFIIVSDMFFFYLFIYLFLFSIYKMVDIVDIYKSLNISIGAVI